MYDIRIVNPFAPACDVEIHGLEVLQLDEIHDDWETKHREIDHDSFGPSVFEIWQCGECLSSERFG